MFNLDDITNENNEEPNFKWPYILDHTYRTLILGFKSGKTTELLNLIKEQERDTYWQDYLYAKDVNDAKHHFLIKETQRCRNESFKWSKSIIEH